MSKTKPTEYPKHDWTNAKCPCFGCQGALKARGGKSTHQWYLRRYGKDSEQ